MLNAASMIAAAGGEHPLIDLDFTVFIQLVLFVTTAIIATKFLFKPYLRLREDRVAGIEGAREEATNMSAQADAQLSDYDSKLASARARAEEERRKLRGDAAAHEREVLEKTRAEAVAAQQAAAEQIVSQTETARAQLRPRADEIARSVATKLLGREVA